MTKKFYLIASLFIGIIFIASCSTRYDDLDIEQAFNDYKFALINLNGEKAYTLVDKKSQNYFDEIVEKAKNLSSYDTKNLPIVDKLYVIMTRHSFSPESLKNISGKELFISTVQEGLIDDESLLEQSAKVVKIEGNLAQVRIMQGDKEFPFNVKFIREGEQ